MAQLSQPLALRPATAADVLRLSELVQAAYGHYEARLGGMPRPMSDDYAEVLSRHEVTVAERDDQVVGLIVLAVTDEGLTIDNVAVDPSHQGSGVGKALLQHAEADARRRGFESIHLYTHERMAENLALYSRIGYVAYDRRPVGEGQLVYLRKFLD